MDIPKHFFSCYFNNNLIMSQPVLCDDGFIYEKELIENYLKSNNNISPMTNCIINSLIINKTLLNEINEFIKNNVKYLSHRYISKYYDENLEISKLNSGYCNLNNEIINMKNEIINLKNEFNNLKNDTKIKFSNISNYKLRTLYQGNFSCFYKYNDYVIYLSSEKFVLYDVNNIIIAEFIGCFSDLRVYNNCIYVKNNIVFNYENSYVDKELLFDKNNLTIFSCKNNYVFDENYKNLYKLTNFNTSKLKITSSNFNSGCHLISVYYNCQFIDNIVVNCDPIITIINDNQFHVLCYDKSFIYEIY